MFLKNIFLKLFVIQSILVLHITVHWYTVLVRIENTDIKTGTKFVPVSSLSYKDLRWRERGGWMGWDVGQRLILLYNTVMRKSGKH